MKNVISLAGKIDKFYRLTKSAAPPLEDVYRSPYSQYGADVPEDKDIPSSIGEMTLPSIISFRKHYANTSYLYKIIYLKSTLGAMAMPISLETYKNKVKEAKDDLELEPQTRAEAEYVLQHFDTIFNPNAINIIANKFSGEDLVGPLGIDHDIGHNILDVYEKFLTSKAITNAVTNDYVVRYVDPESGNSVEEPIDNFFFADFDLICSRIIQAILAKNNVIPGSISQTNIERGEFEDVLADLMVHYNLNGESLSGIKIAGITLYSSRKGNLFGSYQTAKRPYAIAPKNSDGSVPQIESILRSWFPEFETRIKLRLNNLVGKVMALWN